jgi:hypothetical protein
MMPIVVKEQAPVPPPSYQRAQVKQGPALHINALTLVTTLHLLTLCRLAVRLAYRRCPPPLPAGKGGRPRTSSEESLLLISLLRTLWRLSSQDRHDWLKSWPALALACGLPLNKEGQPLILSPSQHCKRRHAAGAPCMKPCLSWSFCKPSVLDSSGPVISSLTVLPSWPGDAVILTRPLDMLPLIIRFLCSEVSASIPSFVAALASLSSFCSLT